MSSDNGIEQAAPAYQVGPQFPVAQRVTGSPIPQRPSADSNANFQPLPRLLFATKV
jgi:hypothetical protein